METNNSDKKNTTIEKKTIKCENIQRNTKKWQKSGK